MSKGVIGRVSRALCLVAFAAGPLYAQDADSISRQLSANDPKSVAWGGYLAGEHRVRAAVPHLIAALDSSRLRQAGREWKAARFAVLDALILLDAQPPADLLVRYYKEHRERLPEGTVGRGWWVGEALIDVPGKVAQVWPMREVEFTPPFPPFNNAIVVAIRQWEFEPVFLNGTATPVCMTVTVIVEWQ